ncbi:MAG: DUF2283 domain-containing protein [ANME-2 cluster archaeon]|jgi:uncharacterized protein YuzE|nr:DUF2283 domain-containing protein [ANME-2 cluster archaeon]MDW7774988.1 DUF2283 domain-containing protein [Methanosarcinales archaeon]
MKAVYDPETDTLTLILRDIPIAESDEIKEGLIIDYSEDNKIVSIEMLDASENVAEPQAFSYEIKGRKATA